MRGGDLDKARQDIEAGLEDAPNQFDLLAAAIEVCRAARDREASLVYALRMVGHHPVRWTGYARAAQDLMVLLRFDEAMALVEAGLSSHPDHLALLKVKGEVSLAARDFVCAERAFEAGQAAALDAGTDVGTEASRKFQLDKCFAQCLDGRAPVVDGSSTGLPVNDRHLVVHGPLVGEQDPLAQADGLPTPELDGRAEPGKRFLFVSGLARSGTTALGSLLNLSHEVCMFTELYPAFRPEGYTRTDFCRASIERKLAAHAHREMDEAIFQQRYESCRYVGDKRPFMQFALVPSLERLGVDSTRVVHISRDLRSVCMSAERRASYPDDPWDVTRGTEAMTCLHNRTTEVFLRLADEHPEALGSIVFVDYDTIFSNLGVALDLFRQLGIGLTAQERVEVAAFVCSSTPKVDLARRSLASTPLAVTRAIAKLLDAERHARFMAMAHPGKKHLTLPSSA